MDSIEEKIPKYEVVQYSLLKTKKEKDDYIKKTKLDPKIFEEDSKIKKDKFGNHILEDEKAIKIQDQQNQIESLTKSLSDVINQMNQLTKLISK
jgi:hypothetical protein